MLIVCPSCASEYEIEPARIGESGRQVRCASCRGCWFVSPKAAQLPALVAQRALIPMAAPTIDNSVLDAPVPASARSRRGRRRSSVAPAARRPLLASGWLAATAAIALLVAAPVLVTFRSKVVREVPGSAGLYAMIGLPVNLVGLKLGEVTSGLVDERAGRVLVVEGEIRHAAAQKVAVPKLDFAVEGAAGETLYRWSAAPPIAEIVPGGSARFTARLPSPPPQGRRVVVSFRTAQTGDALALR